MNENIKLLFEKLGKDEAALAKLKTITDPDEAYALISSIQGGFTKEEFIDAMKQVQASADSELSDADVAAAAGGTSTWEAVSISVWDLVKPAATSI
jgi:hypothetical protein